MAHTPTKKGYRVDLQSFETGLYSEYAGRRVPLTWEMADAYARHLEHSHTGGRIVKQPEEEVVKVWKGRAQDKDAFQNRKALLEGYKEKMMATATAEENTQLLEQLLREGLKDVHIEFRGIEQGSMSTSSRVLFNDHHGNTLGLPVKSFTFLEAALMVADSDRRAQGRE